jgi:hypothetical protein
LFSSKRKKKYILETTYPDEPADNASDADRSAYEKHTNDSLDDSCLMLATMSSELPKQYEYTDAHTMVVGLRGMFMNQARVERYEISKSLFSCKIAEGSPVSPHVIKMMGYIESLNVLCFALLHEPATDLILQSLSPSYDPFILNFHMNGMEKTLAELHGMLRRALKKLQSRDDGSKA